MMRRNLGWCGVLLLIALALPVAGDVVSYALLSGVPDYYNSYGCAPTSGGMIIGYWDQRPGYSNLVIGDVSTWNTTAQRMVASQAWLDAGRTWEGHAPTSLADTMYTVGYDTYTSYEPGGLVSYAEWDDPSLTPVKEAYEARSSLYYWYEGLDYILLQEEIDVGRPMLLNVFAPSKGHAVVAYGYRQLSDGTKFYAVRDTWWNGLSWAPPGAFLEGGVEWWPWRVDNVAYSGTYDWRVRSGVVFDSDPQLELLLTLHTPEPGTMVLFALGLAPFVVRRRRRRAA